MQSLMYPLPGSFTVGAGNQAPSQHTQTGGESIVSGQILSRLVPTHLFSRLDAFASPQSDGGASGALTISNPRAVRSHFQASTLLNSSPDQHRVSTSSTPSTGDKVLQPLHFGSAAFVPTDIYLPGRRRTSLAANKAIGIPSSPTSSFPATHRGLTASLRSPTNEADSVPAIPLPTMVASIEELDGLVRSFYEGRGEQVRASSSVLGGAGGHPCR